MQEHYKIYGNYNEKELHSNIKNGSQRSELCKTLPVSAGFISVVGVLYKALVRASSTIWVGAVIISGSASVVGTPPTLSVLHANNGEETIRDS